MISWDAVGVAGGDHSHDQAQHAGGVWPTVNEIPEKNCFTTVGRQDGRRGGVGIFFRRNGVTQICEQPDEFVVAAVNNTDDVEWPGLGFFVVVERNAFQCDGFRFFGRRENEHVSKPLAVEAAQRAAANLGPAAFGVVTV